MNQFEKKVDPLWLKGDASKSAVYGISAVLSLGLLSLYCHYYPLVGIKLRSIECTPDESEYVLFVVDDELCGNSVQHFQNTSFLEHLVIVELNCQRYISSSQNKYIFTKLPDVPRNFKRFLSDKYFRTNEKCLLMEEYKILRAQYGSNLMPIPESTFLEIAFHHMLSPFFIFQYFSAIVWFCESYNAYAVLILAITFVTVYLTTTEEMFNLARLKTLAGMEGSVRIMENSRNQTVDTDNILEVGLSSIVRDSTLVPGDRFYLVEGMTLPCDAVLIRGRVVIDESMLTGESIPVSKVPIDVHTLGSNIDVVMTSGAVAHSSSPKPSLHSLSASVSASTDGEGEVNIILNHSGSVLFGGTKISACYGEECMAVVCRTGFRSAKGQLVASLLKAKDGIMNFVSDALIIVLFMLLFTTVVYSFVAYNLYTMDVSWPTIFERYLDAVTTAVPALMIASLTVATALSVDRLKLKGIFVTDTSRVNYAGMVNAVSFDKTGTLTKTALNFIGASIVETNIDGSTSFKEYLPKSSGLHLPQIVLEIMATCHSLSLTGYNGDEPVGDVIALCSDHLLLCSDPLEVELLAVTGWSLRQSGDGTGRMTAFAHSSSHIASYSGDKKVVLAADTKQFDNSNKYDVCKHFEFTPDRLRAATILRRPDGSVAYLLKGSPEVIVKLCKESGTVPSNIDHTLIEIARRGLRVIAIACKECLPANKQPSDTTEAVGESNDSAYSELMKMSQDNIEKQSGMKFIGLLFLSNALKDETIATISQLDAARIHYNMITGDHVFTAIAIASQCGIINRHRIVNTYSTWSYDEEKGSCDDDLVYIVDEAADGSTVIIDALNNQTVTYMSLAQLLLRCATSYHACRLKNVEVVINPVISASADGHDLQAYSSIDDNEQVSLLLESSAMLNSTKSCIQIAVTGKGLASVYRNYSTAILKYLIRYARIFARTKPNDKKFVVEYLMQTSEFAALDIVHNRLISNLEIISNRYNKSHVVKANTVANSASNAHIEGELAAHNRELQEEAAGERGVENFEVLFCGDGANDMIALRTASVGVSLCDSETSVAAPLTSRKETPGSVIDVLKEGRCSLITAYVLIVFNILYGAAQLFLTCGLYYYGLATGHYTCLEEDVLFALSLGLIITLTPPADNLSVVLPPRRFLIPYFVSKLAAMLILFSAFQILAQYVLSLQSFYVPYVSDEPLQVSYAWEATVAQDITIIQLMIASVVSAIGAPFRQAWYTNYWHTGALTVLFVVLLVQIFAQDSYFFETIMAIRPLPIYFGFVLLGIMALHVIVCLLVAHFMDAHFFKQLKTQRYENMKSIALYTNKELELETKAAIAEKQKKGTKGAALTSPHRKIPKKVVSFSGSI